MCKSLTRACGLLGCLLIIFAIAIKPLVAQTDSGLVSGRVVDPAGSIIQGAQIRLIDIDRNTVSQTTTNNAGLYTFRAVRPGRYRMEISARGFRLVNVTGLTVNTQANLEQNFAMSIGSVSESITVEAKASEISTSVSTVVGRQFVENMPLNGRSFQSLIELTPGVVLTPSNSSDAGQFSVNGQRADANYWTVDGVSANIGVGTILSPGNGFSGSLGAVSASGGTNSLVSVDALQEFRIQTSSYAPEFGRSPGGQISIETRSGTNQFHGTLFDYLRNDALDASDWFNGDVPAGSAPLRKSAERQNDFGGVLGGPIFKDRTFFFFSYEGLRLRLPQVALNTVPDLSARQNAIPAMQPFLNAFPLPNGPDDPTNGLAQFDSSFSNPSNLDAWSLRIDHRINGKLTFFGRYNYSPSDFAQRGLAGAAASEISSTRMTTQTTTLGSLFMLSPSVSNDLRFNYSRSTGEGSSRLDGFGGAIPLSAPPLPSGFNTQNATFTFGALSLTNGQGFQLGKSSRNLQRQINVVDSLSWQRGPHGLKFGIDFRRLTPETNPATYVQIAEFADIPSAESGSLLVDLIDTLSKTSIDFRNLGVFGQDTWKVSPRLSLTYGLRWDVNLAPSTMDGPDFPAVTGFNLADLSQLALAPSGTPPFHTRYGSLAPRIGGAYQLSSSPNWGSTMRGGFGVFYDLATGQIGNELGSAAYPFGAFKELFGGTFPLNPLDAAPAPITVPPGGLFPNVSAYDPNIRDPYSLEWNVSLEQDLGKQQVVSASYIGAAGRNLLQSTVINSPNPTFAQVTLVTNQAVSNYQALQVQTQRRAARGLQALASYTWSHSIDTASAGSALGNTANALVPSQSRDANRGPSDFDIRNSFSAGLIYDVPAVRLNPILNSIVGGWSLQSNIQAHSAPPVNIFDVNFFQLEGAAAEVRPDVVSGQPLLLHGAQFPGGIAFNPAAFTDPPSDPTTFEPLRQGTLGRNAVRGFGETQWDFGVHRDFPLHESIKLQFRTEVFNLLNHPNFAQPSGAFGTPGFGLSTQMLNQGLGGSNLGNGGFNPLYQIGGPRSIQLALKLQF